MAGRAGAHGPAQKDVDGKALGHGGRCHALTLEKSLDGLAEFRSPDAHPPPVEIGGLFDVPSAFLAMSSTVEWGTNWPD